MLTCLFQYIAKTKLFIHFPFFLLFVISKKLNMSSSFKRLSDADSQFDGYFLFDLVVDMVHFHLCQGASIIMANVKIWLNNCWVRDGFSYVPCVGKRFDSTGFFR